MTVIILFFVIVLAIFSIIFIILEIINAYIYQKVKSKTAIDLINKYIQQGIIINEENELIIGRTNHFQTITIGKQNSFLYRYRIFNVGCVLRFTKGHKLISDLYKEMNSTKLTNDQKIRSRFEL